MPVWKDYSIKMTYERQWNRSFIVFKSHMKEVLGIIIILWQTFLNELLYLNLSKLISSTFGADICIENSHHPAIKKAVLLNV